MNREAFLREWLKEQLPEIRFVTRSPNAAGVYFGHVGAEQTFIPFVHSPTLFDRTVHLDDEGFRACLFVLAELLGRVVTAVREGAPFTEELLGSTREDIGQAYPEAMVAADSAFDIASGNLT